MNEFTDAVNAVFAKRLTDPDQLVGQQITDVFVRDREIVIKTETGQWLYIYSYIVQGYDGDEDSIMCFDEPDISRWTLRQSNLLSAEEYDEQVQHDEKYKAFCYEQQQKVNQANRREQYLRLKREFEGDQ